MLTCTPIDLSCLDVEGVLNANVHTNRPLLSGCGGECSMLTCTPIDLSCLDVEEVLNANMHTNRPLLSGCGRSAQC